MSKKQPTLIPAVGYLRKSTKEDGHEKSIADQKARISKMRPAEHGARYEIIRWYADVGIPGWKPNHKRPDYFRMVNDLRERRDAKAVLVDDMDRFSRKDEFKTIADVQVLRELGVCYIHADNQGVRDLKNDPTAAIRIAVDANASHQYSLRLSRRINEERWEAAKRGERTGGTAPYGLRPCGENNHSLEPGDPAQVKVIRWLFDEFANRRRSLGWLVSDLNYRQKIPAPTGGKWFSRTVTELLRRRCYRGDFEFGKKQIGQFHRRNKNGKAVPVADWDGPAEPIITEGVYKPLVDPATWDKANKRLASLSKNRGQRNAQYALSGILVCGHCGKPMYGTRFKRRTGSYGPVKYLCGSNHDHGRGTCGNHAINEHQILPFVLRTLSQEIADVKELLAAPPKRLCEPDRERTARRKEAQAEKDKLAAQIDRAEENLLACEDARTRKSLDAKVSAMRDQLEKLDAELDVTPASAYNSAADLDALRTWWEDFEARAVSMPLGKTWDSATELRLSFHRDAEEEAASGEAAIPVDPKVVNEALRELGAVVRLRWDKVTRTTVAKKSRNGLVRCKGTTVARFVFAGGRFQLGQQKGRLPASVVATPAGRAIRSPGRRRPCTRPSSNAPPRRT
jgi:DNA invertase Pin-like site-specific DNA recombinase